MQPCNITSWVQFFIHCHKFPGLSVLFLQFILIPFRYSSTIPQNGDSPSVLCYYPILSSWNTHSSTYLSFLSFTQLYSNIPRYISSICLCFHHLVILSHLLNLNFPLFIIITPYFLTPNSMPMSWLKISTVDSTLWFHFHSFHTVLSRP